MRISAENQALGDVLRPWLIAEVRRLHGVGWGKDRSYGQCLDDAIARLLQELGVSRGEVIDQARRLDQAESRPEE